MNFVILIQVCFPIPIFNYVRRIQEYKRLLSQSYLFYRFPVVSKATTSVTAAIVGADPRNMITQTTMPLPVTWVVVIRWIPQITSTWWAPEARAGVGARVALLPFWSSGRFSSPLVWAFSSTIYYWTVSIELIYLYQTVMLKSTVLIYPIHVYQ